MAEALNSWAYQERSRPKISNRYDRVSIRKLTNSSGSAKAPTASLLMEPSKARRGLSMT
jgi:hypothetical protein